MATAGSRWGRYLFIYSKSSCRVRRSASSFLSPRVLAKAESGHRRSPAMIPGVCQGVIGTCLWATAATLALVGWKGKLIYRGDALGKVCHSAFCRNIDGGRASPVNTQSLHATCSQHSCDMPPARTRARAAREPEPGGSRRQPGCCSVGCSVASNAYQGRLYPEKGCRSCSDGKSVMTTLS